MELKIVRIYGLYMATVLFICTLLGAFGMYFGGDYFLLAQKVAPGDYRVVEDRSLEKVTLEAAMLRELLAFTEKAEWKNVGLVCVSDPSFCADEELYEAEWPSRKMTVRVLYSPDGVAYAHRCLLLCPIVWKKVLLLPLETNQKKFGVTSQVHAYTLAIIAPGGFKILEHREFAENDIASRGVFAIVGDYRPLVKKIFQKAKSSARDFHI